MLVRLKGGCQCNCTPAERPTGGGLERCGYPRAARLAVVAAPRSVELRPDRTTRCAAGGAAGACRISGRATSGTTPLPGVAMVVQAGDAVKTATSTDTDGTYRLTLPAGDLPRDRRADRLRRRRARAHRRRCARRAIRPSDFSAGARAARAAARRGGRTCRRVLPQAPSSGPRRPAASRSGSGRPARSGSRHWRCRRRRRPPRASSRPTRPRPRPGCCCRPGSRPKVRPQARRDHRQHGQHRSRHAERSLRGDRPRRVRSGRPASSAQGFGTGRPGR